MKVIKLVNPNTSRESFVIQLPSGKIVGNAVYTSSDEADFVKNRILTDARELMSLMHLEGILLPGCLEGATNA